MISYIFALSLLGRGLTHFIQDPPYWSVFRSEELLGDIYTLFQLSWETYIQSTYVEYVLSQICSIFGGIFLFFALIIMVNPWSVQRMLRQGLGGKLSAEIKVKTSPQSSPHHTPPQSSHRKRRGSHSAGIQSPQTQNLSSRRLTSPPRGLTFIFWICIATFGLQIFYVGSLWWSHLTQGGIWLEQASHLVLPWACISLLPYSQSSEKRTQFLIRSGISLTFIGHSLYVIGFYPIPDDFLIMSMKILMISELEASQFLMCIGCLDLIAALLIWIPNSLTKSDLNLSQDLIETQGKHIQERWRDKSWSQWLKELKWVAHQRWTQFTRWSTWAMYAKRYAVVYMISWGFLTAIARLWGHWGTAPYDRWLFQWIPEVIVRLPHALLPIWLWRLDQENKYGK